MIKVSLSKATMIVVVCLLSILLVARDIFSFSLNKFVYFGICAIGIMLTDKNAFMQLLSFLFPLMCGLPGTYVLLVAVARFVLVEGLNKKTMLYFLFIIIFEILASAWYETMLDSNMVHQMLAICMLFLMLHNHTEVDYYGCMKMYWLGTIVVAFVIVYSTLMNAPANWLSLFAKGWFRFGNDSLEGIQTMTLRLNANTLAYFSLVSIMFGLVMLEREKGVTRIFLICGTVFLALSGVLTNSRAWFFIVLFCFALFLLSQIRDVRFLFGIAIITLIVVFLGAKLIERAPELLTGITTRMTDDTMTGGNGRVDIAIQYLDALTGDMRVALIGAGATYPMQVLGMTHAIHNGTIQILISYGFVGSLLFFIGIVEPLLSRGGAKAPLIYQLPFIGCILFIQTIQFINPTYLIFPYIISAFSIFEGRKYGKMDKYELRKTVDFSAM